MYVCMYVCRYVCMYVMVVYNWILVWDFMGISLVNGIYGGFLQGGAPFDS